MAQYVKFLRGTPKAYENLAIKDNDTLYFIYEEDQNSGLLYLGSKLIAGSEPSNEGTVSGVTLLSQLDDVLVDVGLADAQFLVYDDNAKAWVNKSMDSLLFNGAQDDFPGQAGFVPAPALGQTDLFLKSDGTWAQPAIEHTILTLSNTDQSVHSDLISEATKYITNISGDIVIVKDLIATIDDKSKWQYASYVYDDGAWRAMDGNYNAENVYFDEDLITTSAVGNITLTDGQATIKAAGKNLKEVFNAIFVKENNPTATDPQVSLTFNQAKAYEVGTIITPTYSASLSTGSYTYGPATGIAATSWSISDTADKTSTKNAGSLPDVLIEDNTSYTITATAEYGAGSMPVTNLGNEYPDAQIKEGSASKTSGTMSGYRKAFYGVLTHKNDLTSDIIRGLNSTSSAPYNGQSIPINVSVGALRVVLAYPASLQDLTEVLDKNDSNSNIISGFKTQTVAVEGANKYSAIDYKVYYMDFADAYNTSNVFTAKI